MRRLRPLYYMYVNEREEWRIRRMDERCEDIRSSQGGMVQWIGCGCEGSFKV
jgi:hypothetical protein